MIAWLLLGAWAADLDEVRARAVAQALAVERAEAAAEEARHAATGAIEDALPSIEAFAEVSTGQGQTSFGFARPVATQFGVGGRLSWQAVRPAAWARATAARRSSEGRSAMANWARVDARRDATTLYARARAAQERAEALTDLAAFVSRLVAVVEDRVAAGLAPDVDGARIRAEAATVRARIAETQADIVASCAALDALVGDPVDGACDLAPTTWAEAETIEAEHPALRALGATLGAANAEQGAAKWALGPVLSLSGTAAYYIVPDTSAGFGWNVGAGLTVPLVGGEGRYSDLGVNRARVRSAEAAVEEQRRDLQVADVVASRQLDAARAALAARTQALAATDEARLGAEAQFEVGRVDLTTMLDAGRSWAEALEAAARARAAVGVALAELESARGVW